jgi:hypothetical protein
MKANKNLTTSTRHDRPALIVASVHDYQALPRLKYAQLKADIQVGLNDLRQGRLSTKSVEEIIAAGQARLRTRKSHAHR